MQAEPAAEEAVATMREVASEVDAEVLPSACDALSECTAQLASEKELSRRLREQLAAAEAEAEEAILCQALAEAECMLLAEKLSAVSAAISAPAVLARVPRDESALHEGNKALRKQLQQHVCGRRDASTIMLKQMERIGLLLKTACDAALDGNVAAFERWRKMSFGPKVVFLGMSLLLGVCGVCGECRGAEVPRCRGAELRVCA